MVDRNSGVCSPIRNWEAGELSKSHYLLEMRQVLLLWTAKFLCKSKYMARDLSLNDVSAVPKTFLGMPNKLRGLDSRNVFIRGTEKWESQAAGSSSKA